MVGIGIPALRRRDLPSPGELCYEILASLRTGFHRLAAVTVLLGSAISSFLAAKNRGKLRGAVPMGIVEVLDGMVRA
jgi:hypothetical protein